MRRLRYAWDTHNMHTETYMSTRSTQYQNLAIQIHKCVFLVTSLRQLPALARMHCLRSLFTLTLHILGARVDENTPLPFELLRMIHL